MCGICGVWERDGGIVDPARLVRMRDSLAHRGPDGQACALFDTRSGRSIIFEGPHLPPEGTGETWDLGLGSRRLSIIDLVTGGQPIANEDGSVWVVQNGEIYNYRELREDLRTRGHTFRTESDTEVIVHAYEEYGEDCPTRFNGIFAFAVWDAARRRLLLARDHFGVKPLYYHIAGSRFLFGSEIKAILEDPSVPRELDLDAMYLCLTFRHTPSPRTLFRGIHKLPPGFSLSLTTDGIREHRYWAGADPPDRVPREDEWAEELEAALDRAVLRQMVSDVPIGLSLSSGVDSSSLLALMRRHSRGDLRAFTVGFAGKEKASEIKPARAFAQRFGAEFHERLIGMDDYSGFMTRYLWHLEEPVGNESAAAYFFVADMAKRDGVKVLLNGQGADEAFAGYGRHLAMAHMSWLRVATRRPWRSILARVLAGSRSGERFVRLVHTAEATSEEELFRRVYSIVTGDTIVRLLKPELAAEIDRSLPARHVAEWLARAPRGTALERMTWIDARTSLPDDLLLCEDKMSMAAGVEARVPYLDLELMHLAERIPGSLKVKGRRDKYIQRRALRGILGPEVTARPKMGFDNALDAWLRGRLGGWMSEMVSAPGSFTSTYLNGAYVSGLIREHSKRVRDHQRILFLLLSLESWHQVFFHRVLVPGPA